MIFKELLVTVAYSYICTTKAIRRNINITTMFTSETIRRICLQSIFGITSSTRREAWQIIHLLIVLLTCFLFLSMVLLSVKVSVLISAITTGWVITSFKFTPSRGPTWIVSKKISTMVSSISKGLAFWKAITFIGAFLNRYVFYSRS